MHRTAKIIWSCLISLGCISATAAAPVDGAKVAEIAAKEKALKAQERFNYLLKGALAVAELVNYPPINEFLPLARVFSNGYRSIALQHYFSPRDGILSRTLPRPAPATNAVLPLRRMVVGREKNFSSSPGRELQRSHSVLWPRPDLGARSQLLRVVNLRMGKIRNISSRFGFGPTARMADRNDPEQTERLGHLKQLS